MKYIIVHGASAETVTAEVNKLLGDMWALFGELHVNAYYAHYGEDEFEHVFNYSQAMIKREEGDEDS